MTGVQLRHTPFMRVKALQLQNAEVLLGRARLRLEWYERFGTVGHTLLARQCDVEVQVLVHRRAYNRWRQAVIRVHHPRWGR